METALYIFDHFGRGLVLYETKGGCFFVQGAKDAWILVTLVPPPGAMISTQIALQHKDTGLYLALDSKNMIQITSRGPTPLHAYCSRLKKFVLHTPSGEFLQSVDESGELVASSRSLLIKDDRKSKQFSFQEATLPVWTLQAWPLRVLLRRTSTGQYMSDTCGKLTCNTTVACCQEQFLLDVPYSYSGAKRADTLLTSFLWTGDGRRLITLDEMTHQLLVADQHSCKGRELLSFSIKPNQQLLLNHFTVFDGAVRHRPSTNLPLSMELASGKGVYITTAHGNVLDCRGGMPCCIPHITSSSSGGHGRETWELCYHGDGLYSLQHVGTQRHLYVDSDGVVCLDGNMQATFPDPRVLFHIELKMISIPDTPEVAWGFSIQTHMKFDGRQLVLSAQPGGLLITVDSQAKHDRWELFSFLDIESLSTPQGAQLLETFLPSAENSDCVSQTKGGLRRAVSLSMMAPPSTKTCILKASHNSLPGILEEELINSAWRRCSSEPVLSELDRRSQTPAKGLAELRRAAPRRPVGWGISSAATLQDLACQQLCTFFIYGDVYHKGSTKAVPQAARDRLMALGVPDELAIAVQTHLKHVLRRPRSKKVLLREVQKHAEHAGEKIAPWIQERIDEAAESGLPPGVGHLCGECKALVVPMQATVNPKHHAYLRAQQRRMFGRGAGGDGGDPIIASLKLAKYVVGFYGMARCVAALMKKK